MREIGNVQHIFGRPFFMIIGTANGVGDWQAILYKFGPGHDPKYTRTLRFTPITYVLQNNIH
mgnify:CR=1 FL=1